MSPTPRPFRLLLTRGVALALCTASASAQTSIKAEGEITLSREGVPVGVDPLDPRFPHGWSGEILGEHTLTPTRSGHSRLRFLLWRSSQQEFAPIASIDDSKRSHVDDYLVDRFTAQRKAGITEVSITDRVSSSRTKTTRSIEAEHAIEIEGPDHLVTAALDYLKRFAAANRRIFTIELACVSRILDEDDIATSRGQGPPQVALLDHAAYERKAAESKNSKDANFLASPSLALYGGQQGNVATVGQTAYIADFEVEVANGAVIADPVVKVANDGLSWDVCVFVDPDSPAFLVASRAKFTSLRRPMREFGTTLIDGGAEMKIQIPEFDDVEWAASLLALDDEHRAFWVTGLCLTSWNEDGEPQLLELQLLGKITPNAPTKTPPSQVIGVVLGVDGTNGHVFLRVTDERGMVTRAQAERLILWRENDQVGECTVVENLNGVLVLRLENGEARAGDTAK